MENYIKDNLDNYKEYAWNYFDIHAKQRLTTFNFYITLSTLIGAGGFVALSKSYNNFYAGAFLSVGLILLSFIFWKLDVRNRDLIKNSESALKRVEEYLYELSGNEFPEIKLFDRDDDVSKVNHHPNILYKNKYSYSDCFNVTYFLFGLSGCCRLSYIYL